MDSHNYTETTEDHTPEGYTTSIRKNKIGPQKGGEPLTVIEFSLTNGVKEDLQTALKPFVDGTVKDDALLAKIIHEHMPPEVLKELATLKNAGKEATTIYVVKNLPEISKNEIRGEPYTEELTKFLKDHSYAPLIGKGIGLAIELMPKGEPFVLARTGRDTPKFSHLHIHPIDIAATALGGVLNEGKAATRFTDYKTLLEEAKATPELGAIKVSLTNEKDNRPNPLAAKPLKKLPYPARRGKINDTRLDVLNKPDEPKFEKLVSKHSQEVTLNAGDLVIWPHNGRLFHQAMRGNEDFHNQELVRVAIGWDFSHQR